METGKVDKAEGAGAFVLVVVVFTSAGCLKRGYRGGDFMAWTDGATWPISVYLIVLAVITFIATVAAPETAGKELK